MTKKSDNFELQIHRIYELLNQKGSKVTWDDKISDPDNPNQPRQIDISIKRDNKLTIVECRIHKKSQDVKWIEELIGRRSSLKADAVIAVSSSGFTQGAYLKAKKYGVILRDLLTLTEQEIKAWGHKTKVRLSFMVYSQVEIDLDFDLQGLQLPATDIIIKNLKKSDALYRIFEMASDVIEEKNPTGKQANFKGEFSTEDFSFSGIKIETVKFTSGVSRITQFLEITSVVAFDAPEIKADKRKVHIENVDFGDFHITKSSNKVSVAADLSSIACPPNSQFLHIGFDFGRVVNMESFEILGLPPFHIPIKNIKLGILAKNYS